MMYAFLILICGVLNPFLAAFLLLIIAIIQLLLVALITCFPLCRAASLLFLESVALIACVQNYLQSKIFSIGEW